MFRRPNLAALAPLTAALLLACSGKDDDNEAAADTCVPVAPAGLREGGAPDGGPILGPDGGDPELPDGGRPPLAAGGGGGAGGQAGAGCPADGPQRK